MKRTVARLSTTPVKSMGLCHPEAVKIETFGVSGNRLFFVAEPDGRLVTAATAPTLLAIRPLYDPAADRLTLSFPSGGVVGGDAGTLGRPMTTSFFGRAVDAHVLEGPWAAEVSAHLGRNVVLARCDRPGEGNDEAPVSLLSTASVDELEGEWDPPQRPEHRRERNVDSRRFRMLVEVAGCAPREEDGWTGRSVRLGEVLVQVVGPTARCVITTLDPDHDTKDLDTLRAVKSRRQVASGSPICFGVYAHVVRPGLLTTGDTVEPAED